MNRTFAVILPQTVLTLYYFFIFLKILSDHFGPSGLVQPDEVQQEWIALKHVLSSKYKAKGLSFTEICRVVSKDMAECYPNLAVLTKIAILLPVSTAGIYIILFDL